MLLIKSKHLSQVAMKKISEYFSMYFYGSNLGPLAWGHLELGDLQLNKSGIRPQGNASF